jgi:hypothetical protein
MKISGAVCILSAVFLLACGGSIPEEKRKALREKMEESKIVRVTEVEIIEAAFREGRSTARDLDSLGVDSSSLNAYIDSKEGSVHFIRPGQEVNRLLEKELIDAYLADPSRSFQDNVQKVRNDRGDFDSLLYTKPVTRKAPDGSDELLGVWYIWLSKRELVKDIGRSR